MKTHRRSDSKLFLASAGRPRCGSVRCFLRVLQMMVNNVRSKLLVPESGRPAGRRDQTSGAKNIGAHVFVDRMAQHLNVLVRQQFRQFVAPLHRQDRSNRVECSARASGAVLTISFHERPGQTLRPLFVRSGEVYDREQPASLPLGEDSQMREVISTPAALSPYAERRRQTRL
jgi:hypothetical protein